MAERLKNPIDFVNYEGDPSASPQDDARIRHSDPEHGRGGRIPSRQSKLMISKQAFIYILTNKHNTVFYVGVTTNIIKRIWEHKNNIVKGFTKKYNTHKLVYYEIFDSIEQAITREKYIKGKKREYKIRLIEKNNLNYKDLYKSLL